MKRPPDTIDTPDERELDDNMPDEFRPAAGCTHDVDHNRLPHINEDGRTDCCGAFTSIFMDDGIEYCKCCYREASSWLW